MGALVGRRVLVVGASSGIGRATSLAAVRAGARVVLSARRGEALAGAVAEAGGGVAVAGDVCEPGGPDRIVGGAAAELGEIDLLVYTVGYASLRSLADTDAATWHDTLGANVVGLNMLLRAALPHMAEGGVVAVLSSETSGTPRHGLGPYAASKAALETSLRGWRLEHPAIRVMCVIVGATQPSGFGDGFETDELNRALESWVRHGVMQEEIMHSDDVAAVLVDTLATALTFPRVGIEEVILRSPSPIAGAAWNPRGATQDRDPR